MPMDQVFLKGGLGKMSIEKGGKKMFNLEEEKFSVGKKTENVVFGTVKFKQLDKSCSF